MLSISLNEQGLPYPDPIHPIIVHFVIAMVLFSFLCDSIGYFTRRNRFFEVSFWNLLVASIAIFLAVIFGQLEAGLANTYGAVRSTLTLHTIVGWSLGALTVAITAWRFALRRRNPVKLPAIYLGGGALLTCLVLFQTVLGTRLIWVYGLHIEPVVEASRQGLIQ
ncbi:DUF2231 domain-containing protein [Pannus brasiliensis CCIBt3594]|uniref:DUF2231 domain-containing protein n=1 Tax=Pannus brasiliensis CCIBt3594 TaxID=1427578 RepID=A0AAW9QWG6_9CHRO